MPAFCDVAVPVPLDATFTYSIPENLPGPCVGGRVIVPFREKRLCGIVTDLHDRKPDFVAKPILQVLDTAPALTPELMQLGRWIAQYYIAPIGEVLRTMLPLAAEFRRVIGYHITDKGVEALHEAATVGSSRRSQKEPEHQMQEYRVLNRLADGEIVREATLRTNTGASRAVLQTLLRKKWIAREDLSDVRDASRTIQVAILKDVGGKLNANQQTIVDYLSVQPEKTATVESLRALAVPRTTLQTLVKRGIVELRDEQAGFHMSGMKPRKLEFLFTPAQKTALDAINASVDEHRFLPMLLHGVTGSGKTAVYLSAMQAVLAKGPLGDSAGSGDRAHAGDGRRPATDLCRRGRHPALGAERRRARRTVEAHPQRRVPHCGRHPLGCVCARCPTWRSSSSTKSTTSRTSRKRRRATMRAMSP